MVTIALALAIYARYVGNFPFMSDESIYVYASFALWEGGLVPYRDIYLAHPPLMYLVYGFLLKLCDLNLSYFRLSLLAIHLCSAILLYFLVKALLGRSRKFAVCIATLSMALFATYPVDIRFGCVGIAEPLLTLTFLVSALIAILSLQMYDNYPRRRTFLLLFIVGILLGLSTSIKLTGLMFAIALVVAYLSCRIWGASSKLRALISLSYELLVLLSGIALIWTLTLIALWFTGALHNFYLHVFYWQIVRVASTTLRPELKNQQLLDYFAAYLPLLPFVMVGLVAELYHALKRTICWRPLLMLTMTYFGYIFSVFTLTRTAFTHYYVPASPLLLSLIHI